MKIKYKSWIPVNSNGRATSVDDEILARRAAIQAKADDAANGRAARLAAARAPASAKTVEELAAAAAAAKAAEADDDADKVEDVEDDAVKKLEAEGTKVIKDKEKDNDNNDDDDDWMDDFSNDDDDKEASKDVDEVGKVEDDVDDNKGGNKEMRLRIEEQSALRKTAEAKANDLETRLDEAEAQLKVEQEKSKDLASQSIDWAQHADVTKIQSKFDQSVYRGATLIDDAAAQSSFAKDIQGPLLQEYYDATKDAKTVNAKLKADAAFRASLEKRYDVDIPAGVVAHVKDAVDLYIEMDDKVADLKDRHANNRLSTGIVEYETMMKTHSSRIDDLGNVDDEFMETNPDSIETLVGLRYRDDADFKKKADKLKRRASEFIYGLKPLTQSQIDNVERRATTEGITVQKFMERREANYATEKDKFFNDVFYNRMAMEGTDEMRKVYKRYLKSKSKSKTVRDAASKTKAKETSKVKKVDAADKTIRRGARTSAGLPDNYIPLSKRKRT